MIIGNHTTKSEDDAIDKARSFGGVAEEVGDIALRLDGYVDELLVTIRDREDEITQLEETIRNLHHNNDES